MLITRHIMYKGQQAIRKWSHWLPGFIVQEGRSHKRYLVSCLL